MWQSDEYYLEKAIEVSAKSRANGHSPFGCILVDPDGEIILEQGNVQGDERRCTGHAETVLMERASIKYDKDFLWNCTMYTSCEPCPMCAGAVFWGNVGRVVYAMSEADMIELVQKEEGENPKTLLFTMTAKEVFAGGMKRIKVQGPYASLAEKALEVHRGYYK
ncbi:MAG: nucleoside deaminase [Roseburia sp.]|nr:nucleoside deaminase [Roseburia sp.]